jgi:type I restriction enzyme S subunit
VTIPASWIECKIEDVFAVLKDGRTLHQGWSPQCESYPSPSEDIWGALRTTAIQPGSFHQEHNKTLPGHLTPRPLLQIEGGDILITCAGPRARCGIACLVRSTRPRLMISGKMYRFRMPEEYVDSRFMEYFLQTTHAQAEIDRMKTGGSDSGLNLTHDRFRQLAVPLAPSKEQMRIVEEIEKQFTRLDAAVAALKRLQANLKRYRASVLKAACEGRLVPTEAELARREGRSREPASVFLQRILGQYRKRRETEQLARRGALQLSLKAGWGPKGSASINPITKPGLHLPEGWVQTNIEHVSCLVQYGSSAKTTENEEGAVPVLRMGNLTTDGTLDLAELKYLPADHEEFPELLLTHGDLLFNRTNSAELVGKSAVYNGTPPSCSFASYLIRVKTTSCCDPRYLALCLNSSYGRAWITSVASQQVGQANVNGTKLKAFVFPLPPESEQKRILAEVDRRLSVVEEQETVLDKDLVRAGRLRQAILTQAFKGKLALQDPHDEPASILLERIRGTANRNCARLARSPRGSRRRPLRVKETANA